MKSEPATTGAKIATAGASLSITFGNYACRPMNSSLRELCDVFRRRFRKGVTVVSDANHHLARIDRKNNRASLSIGFD